jgi:sodium-dependent dicarboxylate transporter 2/3/5
MVLIHVFEALPLTSSRHRLKQDTQSIVSRTTQFRVTMAEALNSMRQFLSLIRKYEKPAGLLLGLILCLTLAIWNPFSLDNKACMVLSVATLMISWWVLDALPLPVVALIPIVLFPLLNINSVKEVTSSYADSMIFLFLGGFLIALAIEKWSLHKRIALNIIRLMGTNGDRIILGFIIATGFLSFWLSNTATTMMMFPIALSVIKVMRENEQAGANKKNFALALMLSIAYASNFGFGTIISTPPNVAYVAFIQERFGYAIGFADWMIAFAPLSICMQAALYLVTVKWLFPNHIRKNEESGNFVKNELLRMGPMSMPEKRVLTVFCFTVFLWICKDIINELQVLVELHDTMIAIAGGVALFMIPSGDRESRNLLEWEDSSQLAWGILLLFGGGIALAKELENAGLLNMLGNFIASHATRQPLLMIIIIATVSIFMSEVMSNLAQVIVMAPVVTAVAVAMNMDPMMLGIPMTLAANSASMLPMGTPPNAIVFASGHIKLKDMLRAGFLLNLIAIILISLFCYFLQPLIIGLISK